MDTTVPELAITLSSSLKMHISEDIRRFKKLYVSYSYLLFCKKSIILTVYPS